MGYETLKEPEILLLKLVDTDLVPVPGAGAAMFCDPDNGGKWTTKLPDGTSITVDASGIVATPLGGTPVVVGQSYMTDAKLAGAVGDTVETEATIVAEENTAIVADALSQADVGKTISIEGAGDGADLITTITAVSVDGLTVTLADAATDGGTDAVTFVGTPDEAALADADPGASATMLLPPGKYLIADDLTLAAGTLKAMRGATFVVLEGFTLELSGYVEAAPDQLPGLADAGGNGTLTHTYTEGFYGIAPIAKPTIEAAAAADIITALEDLGLVIDGT